jgi:hypothetical protein
MRSRLWASPRTIRFRRRFPPAARRRLRLAVYRGGRRRQRGRSVPLGSNSANGKYGIPATKPYVKSVQPGTLGEVYAYGCRNPQRFSWDPKNGNMIMADIGQNVNEKVTLVTAGANLGWNKWEGSFTYGGRQAGMENPRGDPEVTYPIVEYDHTDPLFQRQVAVTGVYAYRDTAVRQLTNKLIFGDNRSGELFYVDADNLPKGGQDSIRRVLFDDKGTTKTLLQLMQEKNTSQGNPAAAHADLRLCRAPRRDFRAQQSCSTVVLNIRAQHSCSTFVPNKGDGIIRMLVP